MTLHDVTPDTTIMVAVTTAAPGDVLVLAPGIYHEQVVLKKQLTLISRGDGPVWIDAEATRPNAVLLDGPEASGSRLVGLGMRRSVDSLVRAINGVAGVLVDSCTLHDYNSGDVPTSQYRAGIAVWEGGSHWSIVRNVICRRVTLPGTARGGGNGIWFKSTDSKPSGGNHYIAQNTIVGGYDGIGGETESHQHGGFDRDTLIEANVISETADDGIQVEGGCQNVTVRYNVIHECGTGIALAPVLTGPLHIHDNHVVSSTPGVYPEVVGFKVGRSAGTAEAIIERNTVRVAHDGMKQSNAGLYRFTVRDNVFLCGRYVYELTDAPAAGSVFDRNHMQTTDTTRFVKWAGARYMDLSALRAATGQEMQGTAPGAPPPPPPPPTVGQAWAIIAPRIGEYLERL